MKITLMVLAIVLIACIYVCVRQSGSMDDAIWGVPVDGADKAGNEIGAVLPISRPHSNEVAEIEFEIRQADRVLDCKGNDARFWGFSVLKRIESLPDYNEQRRLANTYMNAMERLRPFDSHHGKVSRSLYNMVLLWPTFTAVQSRLDDQEWPYKLICRTLSYYRQAIRDISKDPANYEVGRMSRSQQDKIRRLKSELKGELQAWGNVALNVYLPSAEKCKLQPDQYVYWKKRVESIMQNE